ncbi:uncharacterized protein Z519_02695 [Cladophialophora bantiana CBS 173.52]|uniref:Pre-rRNA-processing protein RIX1 n=1 Tax=Cladophialophora bantiana (strain ATCC 10958 / CBS 173.52 / CDC B-1940 / NIH 8579) TaxID=1442370 RepID=A0A0D2HVC0_CLAB1|nr:uncharacterized protein Z519_02695 [Cladophialophora bantiana CBS 173.52]KIW97303.1 hypothetical protein Z519_02695 [Cladophialophora bantiana CBS 173.52]
MQYDGALRAIATRLSLTPVDDLPRISSFLATTLAQCPVELLSSDSKGNSSSVTAHKLKTRISSLLQDKSAAGRLTAAVLIKAIVDNGGLKVLTNWEGWTRGLLSCLGKPEPFEVKRVYLATVTRIFVLSQDHPVLLREVTTPLLPAFITTCLGLLKPVKPLVAESRPTDVVNPLLKSVLQCWILLLPQHATVFRPFLTRIKLICLSLLEDCRGSTTTTEFAIRLLCLLLSCAPKNTAAQEWAQTISDLIGSAHQTADRLFRAVLEEYESNDITRQRTVGKHDFSKEPKTSSTDQAGLGPWIGMHDGSTRLAMLMDWLTSLVSTATSQAVTVPLGSIVDLTARILAMTVPGSRSSAPDTVKYNKEASREEKDNLWINLPRLHVSSLRLLQKMCETYGQSFLPANGAMVNHILESFVAMSADERVRRDVYAIFSCLLSCMNTANLVLRETTFSTLLEHCCNDLQRGIPDLHERRKTNPSKDGFSSAKSTLSVGGGPPIPERQSEVFQAAWRLLPEIVLHCPTSMISRQARIEADRLSVLLDHHDAMLASVMRPMLSKDGKIRTSSLLPFLARSAADTLAVEALLRPRMPVTQVTDISTQASRDGQAHIDDLKEVDMSDEDGDILSTPQGPAEAVEPSSERRITDIVGQQDGGEAMQAMTARKRKLEGVQDRDFQLQASISEDSEVPSSRLSKAPRLEDDAVEASVLEADRMIDTSMAKPVATTTSGLEELSSGTGDASTGIVTKMVSPGAIGNRDSDSSDFEIPEIDPGLDTDEEDLE